MQLFELNLNACLLLRFIWFLLNKIESSLAAELTALERTSRVLMTFSLFSLFATWFDWHDTGDCCCCCCCWLDAETADDFLFFLEALLRRMVDAGEICGTWACGEVDSIPFRFFCDGDWVIMTTGGEVSESSFRRTLLSFNYITIAINIPQIINSLIPKVDINTNINFKLQT